MKLHRWEDVKRAMFTAADLLKMARDARAEAAKIRAKAKKKGKAK